MKRFRNGLIVGKFAPLHKGHEYLIESALTQCDTLFLLSYSNPEFRGCEPDKRELWLKSLFGDARSLVLTSENSLHDFGITLPNNSDSADDHRAFVAAVWMATANNSLDAVFTSETYGDGFAAFLTKALVGRPDQHAVEHVLVDLERNRHNISGTELRNNVHELRHHLSQFVYSSFVKRICFLGAESTGKTTLTESLAEHFDTQRVDEYGRTLWVEKGGHLDFEDMIRIAETHIREEELAAERAYKYLFIDTSPLTTLLYSHNLFGKADERLVRLAQRQYDLTFLCYPDFPLVQDGTRRDESFRQMQHEQYLHELAVRNIGYQPLVGSVENRILTALRSINSTLN